MCGIAGIVTLTGAPVRDAEARAERMARLLTHRGPDWCGAYVSPERDVLLLNARLAIVDVKNDFEVPMATEDGKSVLSYNGEIYDFTGHRRRLEARGIRFRTRSDTEVLLRGLRLDGEPFLEALDGFWAFAYYDAEERRLLLARDLIGERHVFYTVVDGELIFASEMNPLLAVHEGSLDIDMESVVTSFRNRTAPPGRTLVDGVRRLHPGEHLQVRLGESSVDTYRPRRLDPSGWLDFFHSNPSENAVLEVYEDVLRRSIASRVPAEVGFMAPLSGGLDSGVLNTFLSEMVGSPVPTLYGISSVEPVRRGGDLDELTASRLMSEKFGTAHHVFSMIDDDCLPLYREQAANSFDGVFCEATVAAWQLAQQVSSRQGRVLLLADGPDELLGGYEKDRSAFDWDRRLGRPRLSRPVRRVLRSRLARRMSGRLRLSHKDLYNWTYLRANPFSFRPIHGGTEEYTLESLFEPHEVAQSLGHYGRIAPELLDQYEDIGPELDLSQLMALSYATSTLGDYFNLRSDRGSMRASVETRMPFQSLPLVELAIATPSRWRFADGSTKYIFRRIIERRVGPEIARRSKYGFAFPAWRVPRLREALDFEGVIGDSTMFSDLAFRDGAREFLLRPDQERTRWFAYCLALVHERLQRRDFSYRDSSSGRGQNSIECSPSWFA